MSVLSSLGFRYYGFEVLNLTFEETRFYLEKHVNEMLGKKTKMKRNDTFVQWILFLSRDLNFGLLKMSYFRNQTKVQASSIEKMQ